MARRKTNLLTLGESVGIDVTVDLDYATWRSLAEQVFSVRGAVRWWVGDLMILGERLFGDDAWQVVPSVYEADTLAKSVRVCEKFPMARRRAELTFGHHQACLRLDDGDADRLLGEAVDGEWSVPAIRKAVKGLVGEDETDEEKLRRLKLDFLSFDPKLVVSKAEGDLRLSELREWAETVVVAASALSPVAANA